MSYWVAYLRKSLDEEGKQVYSLKYQKEEIKKAAAERGITIRKFFEEKKSGTDIERPVFLAILEGVTEGKFTGLVAYSLDRLSRNLVDSGRLFEMFIRHKKGDLFIAQYKNVDWRSYEGAMLFTAHMMGAIFEVLGTQMRTLTAMDYLKEQGRHVGRVPYGYEKQGDVFIVKEDEAKKIREVYHLALEERWGRRKIANELGISDSLVRRILENERYTGYTVVNGQVVDLELPPIIDMETFCTLNPLHELCKRRGKIR